MMRFPPTTLLIEDIVGEAHVLATGVGGLDTTLASRFLGFDICCVEVAAAAIAQLLALRARPGPDMAQDITRVHVEVAEEATIAEEGCAFVAAFTFPLRMIDAAQMAETCDLRGFGVHQVVHSRT